MNSALTRIIEDSDDHDIAIVDSVKGRDGLWGVSLIVSDRYFFVPYDESWNSFRTALLRSRMKIGVWDVRQIIDWPLSDERVIWDVKSLYGGEQTLSSLARERSGSNTFYDRYLELDQKMTAHGRALKIAQMEMHADQAAPVDLIKEWIKCKAMVIYHIFKSCKGQFVEEYEGRWPFIRAVHEMELNGIHVDSDYVEHVVNGELDPASGRSLRSIQGLQKNGFVTTLLNPVGTKTGRLRHEKGFNSLGIPHGPAREAITSRFIDGLIYTFDFNAIDYRCIVKSVGDEVENLYRGAQDFHQKTASMIFKEVTPARRNTVKYLSYIYIYGGSDETVMEKTGLTKEQVQAVIALLDKKIGPIKDFRAKLWMQSSDKGFVDAPGGRRVSCQDADSEGKVMGLYAQSYSSWVFEQAFVQVQRALRSMKSKLSFAVHDEIVIDVHPDDFSRMDDIRRSMEIDGHVVKMKKGRTYGQQAD